jgi:hypothetical protein
LNNEVAVFTVNDRKEDGRPSELRLRGKRKGTGVVCGYDDEYKVSMNMTIFSELANCVSTIETVKG